MSSLLYRNQERSLKQLPKPRLVKQIATRLRKAKEAIQSYKTENQAPKQPQTTKLMMQKAARESMNANQAQQASRLLQFTANAAVTH